MLKKLIEKAEGLIDYKNDYVDIKLYHLVGEKNKTMRAYIRVSSNCIECFEIVKEKAYSDSNKRLIATNVALNRIEKLFKKCTKVCIEVNRDRSWEEKCID